MRRRIICLMLACFMILPLFSGCGTEQSVTEPSPSATATEPGTMESIEELLASFHPEYNEEDDPTKLNLYLCETVGGQLNLVFTKKHYNLSNLNIKIFNSAEEMETQLLPEMLAGGGPDIFLFNSTMLPNFRNYMKQGVFMDLNELIEADTSEDPLNIEDYNAAVIETGMWEGKRCFFPVGFYPDLFSTMQEMCDKYDITIPEDGVAFEEMPVLFSNYIEQQRGKNALTYPAIILPDIAFTYMDMETSTALFDTEEFRELLRLGEELDIYPWSDMIERGHLNTPWAIVADALFCQYYYSQYEHNGKPFYLFGDYTRYDPQTPVLFGHKDAETGGYTAHAGTCFAINVNSEKKELAYDFLKFLLSEETQTEQFFFHNHFGIPVLNSVREDYLNNLLFEFIPEEMYEPGLEIMSSDAGKAFMAKYIEICSNVTKCYMVDGKWREEIWRPMWNDYEDGKITAEQFAQNLQQKSNIYLKE